MGFLDDLPDLGLPDPPPRRPRLPPERDVVAWQSVHCPKCGSDECPIVDSRQIPKRKHRCQCGYEFWSYEINYRDPTA